MIHALVRAICVAALGAIAGAAWVAFAFIRQPDFTLEMDRDLPRNVSGFYPPELIPGDASFAWTMRSAKVNLQGLDRRVAWLCTVRVRGGRSAPLEQPAVDLGVDGVRVAGGAVTNTYQDLEATVPRSTRPGLVFTITSSSTFVPGPGDSRELGVQVDRVQCRPAEGIALPPRRAYIDGMLSGALLGAAFGAIGITAGSAAGAILLVTFAQAFPLASGPAPYSAYADRAPWLAFWIAAAMFAAIQILDRSGSTSIRQTARFAVAFSAGVLYLKLLAILHPSTPLVDALFQAHRLEWVLAGRYFFTQPMPGGVQFPYAIGLYVFAAPWTAVARDHVTLLRIVVCASECVAGALLYPVVARTWNDRLAGAMASALFTAVPISYWVVGNGNLTNAFGQAIALVTLALVVLCSGERLRVLHVAAWTALSSLALLSHVSTFATLVATLVALAALFWWPGGPALRRPARAVLLATTIAVVFSIATYYRHFGDVYLAAARVRATAPSAAAAPPAPAGPAPAVEAPGSQPPTFASRTGRSLLLAAESVGVPIMILAAIGIWRLVVRRSVDPLVLALIAWGIAFVVFFGVGVMRVGPAFERYSLEFVGRVAYATYPAAVIAAAFAAAWAWRSGIWLRVASIVLLVLAMTQGVRYWVQWR
jgi:hypothetical protein